MSKNFSEMKGAELVAAYNALAIAAGEKPVKRFATAAAGVARCEKMAAVRKSAKAAAKVRKNKFGTALTIKIVAEANPRHKGTKAAAKWDEMVAYLKKNASATVADVFSNTSYQRRDYDWDKAAGSIK